MIVQAEPIPAPETARPTTENMWHIYAALAVYGSCKLELTNDASDQITDQLVQDVTHPFSLAVLDCDTEPLLLEPDSDHEELLAYTEAPDSAQGLIVISGIKHAGTVPPREAQLYNHLAGIAGQPKHERPMICTIGPYAAQYAGSSALAGFFAQLKGNNLRVQAQEGRLVITPAIL